MTANHEHTPTTIHVRFAATFPNEKFSLKGTDFDRWLAARDARIGAAAEQRGAERVEQAVLAVLDDYTMPGKLHDPTGIAGAELETLEQYIREAITDALKGDDDA